MDKKITLGILILCICLVLAGCNEMSSLDNQEPSNVSMVTPVDCKSSLSSRLVELRNCDGAVELHRSLAEEAQVVQQITLSEAATSTKTGLTLTLSESLQTRLAEQVERAYQQVSAETNTIVEQKEMVVPLGRIRTYQIYWKQQVFNSTVAFTENAELYTAVYTVTLDIPQVTINLETGCTA